MHDACSCCLSGFTDETKKTDTALINHSKVTSVSCYIQLYKNKNKENKESSDAIKTRLSFSQENEWCLPCKTQCHDARLLHVVSTVAEVFEMFSNMFLCGCQGVAMQLPICFEWF